ncbi:MAG: cysteine dioxygenase [Pseudomonadota bacterium]|nr:cysteine dioxygenase [Pseudomonadota bacterium]
MSNDRPAALQNFITALTALVDAAGTDEPRLLSQGRDLLATLVAKDDWLPDAFAQPHPQYYQQYLLHGDPAGRFSVVSFVWGPGQQTPVHDHTVWGLIGMLRGGERSEPFEATAAGQPMRRGRQTRLDPGDVQAVSPRIGDIHRVANAFDDRVSISVHVYGADIGSVSRHAYDAATGTPKSFVSGYTQPPASLGPLQ